MTLAVLFHPVGDQGALACSGCPGDQDLLLPCDQPVLQFSDIDLTPDVLAYTCALPAVVSVFAGFLLQSILLLLFRELSINERPEVLFDSFSDCLGAR